MQRGRDLLPGAGDERGRIDAGGRRIIVVGRLAGDATDRGRDGRGGLTRRVQVLRPQHQLVDFTVQGGDELRVGDVQVCRQPVDPRVRRPHDADDLEQLVAQRAVRRLEEDDQLVAGIHVELPRHALAEHDLARPAGRRGRGRKPAAGDDGALDRRRRRLRVRVDADDACDLGAPLVADQPERAHAHRGGAHARHSTHAREQIFIRWEALVDARALDIRGRVDLHLPRFDRRRAAHHLLDPALVQREHPDHERDRHGHRRQRQPAAPPVPAQVAQPQLQRDEHGTPLTCRRPGATRGGRTDRRRRPRPAPARGTR